MTEVWREVVARFGMAAHPEGGWYVETWRAAAVDGGRPVASAILFLLAVGETSHWHRVDADELWEYSAGDALELLIATDRPGAGIERHRLGPDITTGDEAQVVVPAGAWQAARPLGAWTLVGCVVAPAFTFDGFELAPDGWEPKA
jgi:predicted cupin superfamily sugar epimerase